ncbi:unnamed protein product [Phytomonas sp. Hart1]|nr:unnamed protein product [Phytomonas sp. Hart1]|eukprot:CCW70194.1 unnamed protein product [Phytomonas sp. isolate Hart1]
MEYLRSRLSGVRFRRARLHDAAALRQWMDSLQPCADGVLSLATSKDKPESESDVFAGLIQTSYLCITAVASAQESLLVGFLALGAGPRPGVSSSTDTLQKSAAPAGSLSKEEEKLVAALDEPQWDDLLRGLGYLAAGEGAGTGNSLGYIQPCNTLWLNMLVAPPSTSHSRRIAPPYTSDKEMQSGRTGLGELYKHEAKTFRSTVKENREKGCDVSKLVYSSIELARELLWVALGTMQGIENLLCPLPQQSMQFNMQDSDFLPQLRGLGTLLSPTLKFPIGTGPLPLVFAQRQKILHLRRQCVLPRLTIRHGCQEDYDDFVPLLLNGVGVRIRLPEEFYLEELLKNQDEIHKVLVAENPLTYEVVGLICAHVISLAEHHVLSKSYQMGAYDKLFDKNMSSASLAASGGLGATQMVRIDFLYWDTDYEGSSWDLLYGLFSAFPTCADTFILLPHATRESSLLKSFHYVPIRPYEPFASRDDIAPMPDGLWICSRDSLSATRVRLVRTVEDVSEVKSELLQAQSYDMTYDEAKRLSVDLHRAVRAESPNTDGQPDTCLTDGEDTRKKSLDKGRTIIFTLSRIALEGQSATPSELVGMASLCSITVKGLHALRANYGIDNYVYFYARRGQDYTATDICPPIPSTCTENLNVGEAKDMCVTAILIRSMYVKTIYQGWIRLFVRELLRLCRADIAVLFPVREQGQLFPPLIRELLPCQPRRVVEQTAVEDLTGAAAASVLALDPRALGSLFVTTPRYLGDEKVSLYARIVVVGGSATALSFFHRLLSVPYVRFVNLVLVSTDGFPLHANQAQADPAEVHADGFGSHHRGVWLVDTMELLEREHHFLSVSQSIRVVSGRLVDIDKANRCVAIDNAVFEPYDYLILATGRQYVVPPSIHQLLQQEGRGVPEKWIIPLNNDAAFHRARESLDILSKNVNSMPNVLVYGSSLDAYSVVTAIIQREGFSPQRVVVCSRDSRTPHLDEASSQAALTVLRSLGTNVFRGFDLGRIEFNEDGGLTSVVLEPVLAMESTHAVESAHTTASSVELTCGLILCVEDQDIDPRILCALNKRSIVLDGRVIVDKNYQTTDPRILAAGPVAMWTRRYGVTPNFEDFSARDVGHDLARKLLIRLGFAEFSTALLSKHDGQGNDDPSDDIASAAAGDGVLPTFQRSASVDSEAIRCFLKRDVEQGEAGTGSYFHQQEKTGPDLSVFSTPRVCRVVFPFGFKYFSVECISFAEDACDVLSCSNICNLSKMQDRLLLDMDSSTSLHPNAEESDRSGSERMNEGTINAGICTTVAPPRSSQSVLSIYVNRANHTIDAIRYFGDESPELYNYMALIGYPELLLNLTFRYKEAAERSRLTQEAHLPPTCCLTAGVLNHQLDLINYLRLPYFRTIFSDRFVAFFATLRQRMRQHEEFIRVEEQILARRMTNETFVPLTEEEANTRMKTLTNSKCAFRQEIELALVRFLHESKEFRPNNTYLPNVKHLVDKKKPIVSLM